jgi:Ni/Co efflux regulator RcnB
MKTKLFIALFAMSFLGANLVSAQDKKDNYEKSDKKELKAQKKAMKGKEHKAAKKQQKAEDKAEVGR